MLNTLQNKLAIISVQLFAHQSLAVDVLSLSACRFPWELVWAVFTLFFHIWQYLGYLDLLTDFKISKP